MTHAVQDTGDCAHLQADSAWDPRLEAIARQAGQEPDDVADLIAPVLLLTDERLVGSDIHRDPIVGPAVRWAVLHGFHASAIADLFGLPFRKVQDFMAGPHCPNERAQQAVALAKGGRSVTEIRNQLDLGGKGWLYRTLEHARVGTTPFGDKAATTPEQRAKAVRFYNNGFSYKEIEAATGMSLNNVKNTLRAAAKRGELPEYGTRKGFGQ